MWPGWERCFGPCWGGMGKASTRAGPSSWVCPSPAWAVRHSAWLWAFISLYVNLGGTSWAWARHFPYSISRAEPPSRHAQRVRARPRPDGHWRPRFTSLCLGLLTCTIGKRFLPARVTLKLTFVYIYLYFHWSWWGSCQCSAVKHVGQILEVCRAQQLAYSTPLLPTLLQ